MEEFRSLPFQLEGHYYTTKLQLHSSICGLKRGFLSCTPPLLVIFKKKKRENLFLMDGFSNKGLLMFIARQEGA